MQLPSLDDPPFVEPTWATFKTKANIVSPGDIDILPHTYERIRNRRGDYSEDSYRRSV